MSFSYVKKKLWRHEKGLKYQIPNHLLYYFDSGSTKYAFKLYLIDILEEHSHAVSPITDCICP